MDEQGRKKYPSIPPDYVTLAMLRERWLQKQEEQNLKEKQKQEETQNLENGCQNQPHEELGVRHRFENNGPSKRVEKGGREKGKGKEINIACSENGDVTKKYYSKNKKYGAEWEKGNRDKLKVQMEDTEKRQNLIGEEGLDIDEKKNGSEGVKINLGNQVKMESGGTQGIGKIVSVSITEVLPKNGVREGRSKISTAQNVRRVGFRGGFRRNQNNRDEGFRGKEYRVKLKELKEKCSLGKKMEDEVLEIDRKDNGRKWRHRRGSDHKFKQSRTEMCGLKLNEELKSEDEISETGSERDSMKGLHSSKGRNDIKQNRVNGEAMTTDTVVLENKAEDTVLVEKSRNDGFRGYGDWRGNLRGNFENFTIDDKKERDLGSKVEKFSDNRRYANSRRYGVERKMKQRDSVMVWVKKEQPGDCGSKGFHRSFTRSIAAEAHNSHSL